MVGVVVNTIINTNNPISVQQTSLLLRFEYDLGSTIGTVIMFDNRQTQNLNKQSDQHKIYMYSIQVVSEK